MFGHRSEDTAVIKVNGKQVFVRMSSSEQHLREFDSIIVVLGPRSPNELQVHARNHGIDVKAVGDVQAPRQIMDVRREEFEAVMAI